MSKMKSIKNELIEMWSLVHSQLKKSYKALNHFDKDLAREVILLEERVDSSEVLINSDCEDYFALQSFYPVNIPYLLGVLKTSFQLERIGGITEEIANCTLESDKPFSKELLSETRIIELFRKTINLSALALDSFEEENLSFNQLLEQNKQEFNNLNQEVNKSIISLLEKEPDNINQIIALFSIAKDLERIADQIILIPHVIFYEEIKAA
jgi:phosphate transport system protein